MSASDIICSNACICPNDGSPADRVGFGYLCQAHPTGSSAHYADAMIGLVAGLFTVGTPPTYSTYTDQSQSDIPPVTS